MPSTSSPSCGKAVELTDAPQRTNAKTPLPPKTSQKMRSSPPAHRPGAAILTGQGSAIFLRPQLLAGRRRRKAEPTAPQHWVKRQHGDTQRVQASLSPAHDGESLYPQTHATGSPPPPPRASRLKPQQLRRGGRRTAAGRTKAEGRWVHLRGDRERARRWGRGGQHRAWSDRHKRDRVPPAPAPQEPHGRRPGASVPPKRSLPALPL